MRSTPRTLRSIYNLQFTIYNCGVHFANDFKIRRRRRLQNCTLFIVHCQLSAATGLASSAFARHYLRNLNWFLFLPLLRCFSSGGSPHTTMNSLYDDWAWPQPDFSIRTSADIFRACQSPQLFAAYHVLHRLLMPRHPPCALISLTNYPNGAVPHTPSAAAGNPPCLPKEVCALRFY